MAIRAHITAEIQAPLTVSECRDWNELERLRPEWDRILALNSSLGLFSTPEWLGPWWRAYGGDKELLALLFKDRTGTIVGIIPLYVERIRAFLLSSIKELRLVGNGSQDSDDLDFIVLPGHEEAVLEEFLKWANNNRWDVCELNCISATSVMLKLLRERVVAAGWCHADGKRPKVTIELPQTWEQYLKLLSSKERGKVRNRYRLVQNRFQLRFYRCETLNQLPSCLETLFRLHQMRWESRGEPGSFALAERRTFYYEMGQALLRRNWLELWFMELDGQTVASQIAMRYGNRVHALQEGFDPAYSKESAGYVLRSHVLRHYIENGISEYDFLAGDQESKQRWGAEVGHYLDFHFARPGSKGVPHLHAVKAIRSSKNWLRRHLPVSVVKRVQSFRKALAGR